MGIPLGLKKTAVICVLRHKQHFLLLKRNKQPNKGLFTPVGGKLEPFESPKQAVIREVWEETGISLLGARYCGVLVENSPTDYNWCSFVYLADIDKIIPPFCPEGELEWVGYDALPDLPTPPTDWHIYQYIAAQKTFAFHADYDAALNLQAMSDELTGQLIFHT